MCVRRLRYPSEIMDKKRVLRIGGIVAVILVAIYAFSVLTDGTRGYDEVDTSVAVKQLDDGNVREAQINDREQELLLTLRSDISVDGKDGVSKVVARYPARTGGTTSSTSTASSTPRGSRPSRRPPVPPGSAPSHWRCPR